VPRGQPDFCTAVREKGSETLILRKEITVPAWSYVDLLDVKGRDLTFEVFEIGTNNRYVAIGILPYNAAGETTGFLALAEVDGSATLYPSIHYIHEKNSIVWFELFYDTANDRYKVGLGYSLRFGNGLLLRAYNFSGSEAKVAVAGMYYVRT